MTSIASICNKPLFELTQAEQVLRKEVEAHVANVRAWCGIKGLAIGGMIGASAAFVACGGLKRIMAGRQQAGWSA